MASVSSAPKIQRYTVKDPAMQRRIEQYLFQRSDAIRESEQYCIYRAKITHARQVALVKQYTNGTLLVQGPDPLFGAVNATLAGILGAAQAEAPADARQERAAAQVAAVRSLDVGERWIGTDEAGKGDYFGPLVGAALLADADLAAQLERMGVRDSKELSDARARELAAAIRALAGERAQVVAVGPERYNALYAQFRADGQNLNTLLAWVHARALENLLERFPQPRITVIIDKFANERYIEDQLMAQGRAAQLDLRQLPKAEANIAVAAASILARARFLDGLDRLSRDAGVRLLKGASDPRIVEAAREVVARHGDAGLAKVAKLHFKTTQQVRS